jgi:hypothetical protein
VSAEQPAAKVDAGSANTGAASDPSVCAAFELGWSIERLYRARLHPIRPAANLPDRLPGVGDLDKVRRAQIDLDRMSTALADIASALHWATGRAPDFGPVKQALDAFLDPAPAAPATRTARKTASAATATPPAAPIAVFQQAVLTAHQSLLVVLNGNLTPYGKAYGLGRALADTVRPAQSVADLQESFAPYRLGQLQKHLDDLASLLPEHASKSVIQSLTWWRDVVYLSDDSDEGARRRTLVGSRRSDAPGLRHRLRPNTAIKAGLTQGNLESLADPLIRQGDLWRLILSGEKKALDLLTPDDYLAAARRALADGRRLATRAILAEPLATLLVVVMLSVVGAAVGITVYESSASGGGRLAAYLVTIGGYIAVLGRALLPRLRTAGAAAEKPLWGAAVDFIAAEAVSVPPVGPPDRKGWTHFVVDAAAGALPKP